MELRVVNSRTWDSGDSADVMRILIGNRNPRTFPLVEMQPLSERPLFVALSYSAVSWYVAKYIKRYRDL